jgi:1,4-dihydroxy-2-naphthoate octaprenyltransferase
MRIGVGALAVAAACGAVIAATVTPMVLAYGVVGAFAAFFYTAPPIKLVHRRGLGELFIGLCFGPLMTAGTFTAMTGTFDVSSMLIGLPIGLLTTAILWINQFPDMKSDAKVGKNNLVVTLGKPAARWGYAVIVLGAYVVTAVLALEGTITLWSLAVVVTLPIAVRALMILWRSYEDRALVKSNSGTIQLQALFGLLMAAALAFG